MFIIDTSRTKNEKTIGGRNVLRMCDIGTGSISAKNREIA